MNLSGCCAFLAISVIKRPEVDEATIASYGANFSIFSTIDHLISYFSGPDSTINLEFLTVFSIDVE